MRRVEHPGPVAAQRRLSADCNLRHEQVPLEPGRSLLDVIAAVHEERGCESAVVKLRGGSFDPFVFVMPDLSPTPAHAVYFSDRHEPKGRVRLEAATVTVGRRGGQPWLHGHGTWLDEAGNRLGGHILPNEAVIAEAIDASFWFLQGAAFEVTPSPETSFTLFEPVTRQGARSRSTSAFAMGVRANEDLCTAIEDECRERGIRSAVIRGGVGSLVGATFEDGRVVEPFVTEVFIREGRVHADGTDAIAAEIDVTVVDYLGGLNSGRLQRGSNAVLVTFELVIEPTAFAQNSEAA